MPSTSRSLRIIGITPADQLRCGSLTLIVPGMNHPAVMVGEALEGPLGSADLATIDYGHGRFDADEVANFIYATTRRHDELRLVAIGTGTLPVLQFLRHNAQRTAPAGVLTPVFIDPVTRLSDTTFPVLAGQPPHQAAANLRRLPSGRFAETVWARFQEFMTRRGITPEPEVPAERVDEFYRELFQGTPLKAQLSVLEALALSPGVTTNEFGLPAVIVQAQNDQLVKPAAAESLRYAFREARNFTVWGASNTSFIEHPCAWNKVLSRALSVAASLDEAALSR